MQQAYHEVMVRQQQAANEQSDQDAIEPKTYQVGSAAERAEANERQSCKWMIAMLQSLRLEQTSSAHQQLKVFKIPARYRPRIQRWLCTVCYGPKF